MISKGLLEYENRLISKTVACNIQGCALHITIKSYWCDLAIRQGFLTGTTEVPANQIQNPC